MEKTFVFAMAAGLAMVAAGSAVPGKIVYQGQLRDPVSGPLAGELAATFSVFADPAGGEPLWSAEQDIRCTTNGAFHALLDGGDALAEAFDGPERFLQLQVADHGEAIAPRVAFSSVPQVLFARWARQSPLTFPVFGPLAVSNAISVADMAELEGGAAFGELAVEGDAAWEDDASPLEVEGAVEAERFEGDGLAPVGSIVLWMDAGNIPAGWALCDGNNGTPDLRDRFLAGVGGYDYASEEREYALGQTGGSDEVALSVAQMPPHAHTYTTAGDRTQHYVSMFGWSDDDWWQNSTDGKCKNGSTEEAGGGEAHENRPPYVAGCFIMRVE